MPTTSQRLAALETDVASLKAWKTAHLDKHVLSGHTHPTDATDEDVAALDSRVDALEGDQPVPVPVPTPPDPTPPPLPAVTRAYGSIGADTRDNHRVGDVDNGVVTIRIPATTSSTPTSLRTTIKTGQGATPAKSYSKGDGGTWQIKVDGVVVNPGFQPGNPGAVERWTLIPLAGAKPVVKGATVVIEISNVHPDPVNNWCSINALATYAGSVSKAVLGQPFELLRNGQVKNGQIPVVDIGYADGTHDGQAYMGAMIEAYAVVSGSSKVRQTIRYTGAARAFTGMGVRVRRTFGNDPLTLSLVRSDGSTLASGTVSAALIPQSNPGNDDGGAVWARVSAPFNLAGFDGALVLSCPATSQYTAFPVQKSGTAGDEADKQLRSYAFRDGQAEKSMGGAWTPLYPYTNTALLDLQFELTP